MGVFDSFYECPICGAKICHTGVKADDSEAICTHIASHSLAELLGFMESCIAYTLQKNVKVGLRLRKNV